MLDRVGTLWPSTVKQIIDGKHVKRGKRAHIITLQALFSLYLEAFLEGSPDVRCTLEKLSTKAISNQQHESNDNVAMLPFIITSLILPTSPRC